MNSSLSNKEILKLTGTLPKERIEKLIEKEILVHEFIDELLEFMEESHEDFPLQLSLKMLEIQNDSFM